ncbi:MAG TPA: Na/Pi cotransporter family protein [Burkholderiaceae bacterium]|nr:Na/Pi cotransporter family protein [Burkholderiaceae bacterium]
MQTLLNLLAAIALLVWGTHIVRSGVLRVYGANLRQVLRRSVGSRSTSFAAGVGVTGLLQSSTATALLASSFVSQGMITTSAALAVMLGADVGTALMVQFFSLDLAWLAPLLIVAGVAVYLSKKNERAGQIGKIVLGLGVMILALQMVTTATAPLTQASGVRVLFGQLSGDLLLDVLIGALLVVVSYSSLAVVLLVATLAATHVVPIEVALPIVLGANLGSGLLALLTTWKADAVARRVPLGNFMFKAAGVACAVLALPLVTPYLAQLQSDPQQLVVQFHLLFNIVLAIAFIQFTERFASIAERWLPTPRATDTVGQPKYLDPVALDTPALALGNAAREAIRLADTVHEMLIGLLTVLKTNDLSLVEALRRKDDEIDRLYSAIKRYLAQVSREALEANESRRWTEIIQFTINLEHIGDIIERLLLDIAQRKIQHKLSFSVAGMNEISDLHARLAANLQLAVAVFLNGDLKSAQRLIAEKVAFRELELRYADHHLHRLFENTQQSVETSSLHLDLLSDFKRINSLICSVSYPILESAGVLAKTRVMAEQQPSLFNTKGPAANEVP